MTDVTHLLDAAAAGDRKAAADLLPAVYADLRALAAARLAGEKPGYTLQPTALVHEAYLRLVGGEPRDGWNGRGHFFAAAAEAMRRILVESARRKGRGKHGGGRRRVNLDAAASVAADESADDLLDLDAALNQLEAVDPPAAQLVKLRYFAGLTLPAAAELIGVSRSTAEADWTYAKAWLKREMEKG
jgi:RNA polymerase sigma factor (TIGR02999 family)